MRTLKKILRITGLAFFLLLLCYGFFIRSLLMHWGATATEINRSYPGDNFITDPGYENILAITINRPPSRVWPWLAQMGLDKAGFYSYTWLENMFGCDLHNADEIHAEWQFLKVGDRECVCREAERKQMGGWLVMTVESPKMLVYRSVADSSWMMGFYIDSVNAHRSRLITRMRYVSPHKFWSYIADKACMEWVHCVMQRGTLNGIKQRAENN
jgi:hypothetical protein